MFHVTTSKHLPVTSVAASCFARKSASGTMWSARSGSGAFGFPMPISRRAMFCSSKPVVRVWPGIIRFTATLSLRISSAR